MEMSLCRWRWARVHLQYEHFSQLWSAEMGCTAASSTPGWGLWDSIVSVDSFFFKKKNKLYHHILIIYTNGFHDGILYTYIMDFEPVFSLLFPSLPVDLLPFPNRAPFYFHVFLTQLIWLMLFTRTWVRSYFLKAWTYYQWLTHRRKFLPSTSIHYFSVGT